MPQPHFTLTITASAVAWYAAVLSTASTLIQTANYFRDRVRLKILFQKNMQMIGDPHYADATLTIITVTNVGRRPVMVTHIGTLYLNNLGGMFGDTRPPLACELTEGKQVVAVADQRALDLAKIRCILVSASGRSFRLNIAPWHERLIWYFRRRREIREQRRVLEQGSNPLQ